MTKDDLEEQGFIFETLPSGRINIKHKDCFLVNGFMSSSAGRGQWIKTIEVKSLEEACTYIKYIEFITDFI